MSELTDEFIASMVGTLIGLMIVLWPMRWKLRRDLEDGLGLPKDALKGKMFKIRRG